MGLLFRIWQERLWSNCLKYSADPESWYGDIWFDSDDLVKEIADSEH